MRRSLTIAAGLATAGVVLAAIPVTAATNGTCNGTGPRAGAGQQAGQGPKVGMGRGMGPGQGRGPAAQAGQGLLNVPTGTLTDDQKADLAFMAQEEKLAGDVYTVLSKKYPKTKIFKNIAKAERRHATAIDVLLDRYGLANPTDGVPAGTFPDADLQTMYNDLIASATSRTEALKVGVAIEGDDIDALAQASADLTAADVSRVYSNLTRASQMHLAAFESRL